MATLHGLWDLNSPTRDWARVHGSESAESQPLDHQGSPPTHHFEEVHPTAPVTQHCYSVHLIFQVENWFKPCLAGLHLDCSKGKSIWSHCQLGTCSYKCDPERWSHFSILKRCCSSVVSFRTNELLNETERVWNHCPSLHVSEKTGEFTDPLL